MFDEQNNEANPNNGSDISDQPAKTEITNTESTESAQQAASFDTSSNDSAFDEEPTTLKHPTETPEESPVVPDEPVEPTETPFPPTLPTENENTREVAQTISSYSDNIAPVSSMSPKTPSKKSKKPLMIGIIIAAVLVVLGGGSALAYTLYETPQKVLTDAIVGLVTAKTSTYTGTIAIDSSGTKAQVELTAKSAAAAGSLTAKITLTVSGETYTLTGDGVSTSSGDLYIKLSNLNNIATIIKAQAGASADSLIDSLQAKVDGKWIKISASDLSSFSTDASKVQTCYSSTLDKYKNDTSATKQITDLYSKYPFITVEKNLSIESGSIGYQLGSDKTALKSFTNGLSSTAIYKSLHDCDRTFTIDDSTLSSTDTSTGIGTLQVWIGQWSHQLTKVVVHSNSDGSTLDATINSTFNQTVTVDTPANSITLAQLESDITGILKSVTAQ
jgi:flagellar basal body-associated protein FliL